MGRLAGLGGAAAAALLLALLRCGSAASVARRDRPAGRNDRPIIGILSQECHFDEYQRFGRSYIAASYVKFVESAGARAVPIRLNLTDEEYDKIFHSINGIGVLPFLPRGTRQIIRYNAKAHPGIPSCLSADREKWCYSYEQFCKILLPGGGVDLRTSEYSRVAKIFYHKALEANDKEDYFPIWGTCLGHEELTYLTSGEILLVHTKTNGFSLPLNFTTAAKDSKMFRSFPDDVLYALATEPLTSNFHVWSLSMENFTNNEKLRNFYKVLTTNTDDEVEFISTMEAYKYPIYGMQWHPEKNPFEWKDSPGIPHSPSAVRAAYYMADFFVNEARKSMHHFSSEEEETKELIYNYNPVYTGTFSAFQQTYFFD